MRRLTLAEQLLEAGTVARAFELYEANAVPKDAGTLGPLAALKQREHTERTFYAAVDWVLKSVVHVCRFSDEEGNEVEERLAAFLAETIAFASRDLRRLRRRAGL